MNSKPLDIDTVLEIERMIQQAILSERDTIHEAMEKEQWDNAGKAATALLVLETLLNSIHARAMAQLTGR